MHVEVKPHSTAYYEIPMTLTFKRNEDNLLKAVGRGGDLNQGLSGDQAYQLGTLTTEPLHPHFSARVYDSMCSSFGGILENVYYR